MEDTRIRFSSLTVQEDEIASSAEEEDLIYSSSSSSEEEEEVGEDEDKVVWSPAHPRDLDSLPKSVLLEVQGYFDSRTNATTAYAPLPVFKTHRIQVTLWIAHSPRVSFLTVHSSGLDTKDFAKTPMVVAALDDLVLLRVTGPSHYDNNYYVYKAGIEPSLALLPDASSFVFADYSAGILGLGDGNFIIAAIQWAGTHGQYDHQFDSRTWSWTSRLMHADKPERFSRIHTDKVLVIGGERGLVAWVDLWNGILFCEVLTGDSVLRYCPLPTPLTKRGIGPPEYVRDIAIVEGRIKFFEMRLKVKRRQVAYNTTFTSRALVATMWKMMDPWREWHKDCAALDIYKIPLDKIYSALIPILLRKRQGTRIALEGLDLGLPAPSLHEDDVVYIMAKTDERKRRAIVLAVNLRKKVLQGVAKFGVKRTYGFSYTYLQSGISNYMTVQLSVSYNGMDQKLSRLWKLSKHVSTAAYSSRLSDTQAGVMNKGNDVDSSKCPVTQAGDMYKENAANSSWVYVSRARKKKGKIYSGSAIDSSRRPITQAGNMYRGNVADSGFVQISKARKQRV